MQRTPPSKSDRRVSDPDATIVLAEDPKEANTHNEEDDRTSDDVENLNSESSGGSNTVTFKHPPSETTLRLVGKAGKTNKPKASKPTEDEADEERRQDLRDRTMSNFRGRITRSFSHPRINFDRGSMK